MLFFGCNVLLGWGGHYIGDVSIPVINIDLLVVAPLLTNPLGYCLAVSSVFVSIARIVQSVFGFDQLFVSVTLLALNLKGFPVLVLALMFFASAVVFGFFYVIWAIRGDSVSRVGVRWLIVIVCAIGALRLAEDKFRWNVVGTSAGYIIGQTYFSSMFHANYSVPGGPAYGWPVAGAARAAFGSRASVFFVIVESLGLPEDRELYKWMFAPLLESKAVRTQYSIQTGALDSIGSTIHGEIRALCGGVLVNGLFEVNSHCYPAQFRRAGYTTTAVHANASGVYGRNIWYPLIGFDYYMSSTNTPSLKGTPTLARWGSLSDDAAIGMVTAQLLRTSGPKFVYLLTVSTHLPAVLMTGAVVSERCIAVMSTSGCIHLANLRFVLTKIASSALRVENTVFVVVGDHPPPFVDREAKTMFSEAKVPWVTLVPTVGPSGGVEKRGVDVAQAQR